MPTPRRTCPYCSYTFAVQATGERSVCPQCNRQLPSTLSELNIPQEIQLSDEEEPLEIELDPAFRKPVTVSKKSVATGPVVRPEAALATAVPRRQATPASPPRIRVQVPRRPVEEIKRGERGTADTQEIPACELPFDQETSSLDTGSRGLLFAPAAPPRPLPRRHLWLALLVGALLLAAASTSILLFAK